MAVSVGLRDFSIIQLTSTVLVSRIILKSCKPTETEVLTTISIDHSRARYVSRTGVHIYGLSPSPVSGGGTCPLCPPGSDAPERLDFIHILDKLKIGFYSRLHDSDNVVLQCCMSRCHRGGWSQLFSQYNVNVGEFVQFHVIFDSFRSSVLCV